MAPVGVATDRLRASGAFGLLGHPAFSYSDGGTRELFAAYAMPDPGGGQGWVAGLALHVFEQDEGLAARLRRLLLNTMLLSGTRRLSTQGEPTAPTPGPATATLTPRRSPTASPTESLTLTVGPSFTCTVTWLPTTPPTPIPTVVPSPVPTLVPTRIPTLVPTLAATPLPKLRVEIQPTLALALPTALPTMIRIVPSSVPSRTSVPTPRATSTQWVLPSPQPTIMIRTLAPTKTVPTPSPTLVTYPKSKHKRIRRPQNSLVPTLLATARPTLAPTVKIPMAVDLGEGIKNALGCLDSAPEPFGEGGVYLQFCIKVAAKIQVNIYDSLGRPLWHSDTFALDAGNQQVFYDGRANGQFIVPGRYLWEVHAQYGSGSAESRQGVLTRRREKYRR